MLLSVSYSSETRWAKDNNAYVLMYNLNKYPERFVRKKSLLVKVLKLLDISKTENHHLLSVEHFIKKNLQKS